MEVSCFGRRERQQQKQGCKHPLKVAVEPLCFQCLQVGVTAVEGYCELEAMSVPYCINSGLIDITFAVRMQRPQQLQKSIGPHIQALPSVTC